MLIGFIRPAETRTATVEAHSLAEAHEMLEQQFPAGFDLANAPVQMGKGTMLFTAVGTYVRRDGGREIEAARVRISGTSRAFLSSRSSSARTFFICGTF